MVYRWGGGGGGGAREVEGTHQLNTPATRKTKSAALKQNSKCARRESPAATAGDACAGAPQHG